MTPIASPRFSNGNTWATPGSALSASVRWAQASMMVRMRVVGRLATLPSCAGEKQTTSQRPTDSSERSNPISSTPSTPWCAGPKEGERFSKTTTS
ncbi:hypothetical protein GCM10025874_25610 [Arenivirga flava]|uniref:Uncharacterized protein n=1 Tax=Arenivirga flava TaxID=1930060 RepID=A0AA37XBY0_9MICO|nr:hypothetical protein GCM10025874_25610 [Arenivirga flava]